MWNSMTRAVPTESRGRAGRQRGRRQRASTTRLPRWAQPESILDISPKWSQRQQDVTWIALNSKCRTGRDQSIMPISQTHMESFQRARSNQTLENQLQRINGPIWKENKPMLFACRNKRLQPAHCQAKRLNKTNRADSIPHTQLAMASMQVPAHGKKIKRSSAAGAQCIEEISIYWTIRHLRVTEEADNITTHLTMTRRHPPQRSVQSAKSTREAAAWTSRPRSRAKSKIWSTGIPKQIRLVPRDMRWISRMMRVGKIRRKLKMLWATENQGRRESRQSRRQQWKRVATRIQQAKQSTSSRWASRLFQLSETVSKWTNSSAQSLL